MTLGLGMSSRATRDEVRRLALGVLARAGVGLDAVNVVATRTSLVDDDRAHLGPLVIGIDDDVLLDRHRAPPWPAGPKRFGAMVAEGCALEAAGPQPTLLVATTRSAHATAALATAAQATATRPGDGR